MPTRTASRAHARATASHSRWHIADPTTILRRAGTPESKHVGAIPACTADNTTRRPGPPAIQHGCAKASRSESRERGEARAGGGGENTPVLSSKPSISVSSWLIVCTFSSFAELAADRACPTPSNSSMKSTQGALFRARSNMSLTRAAPTPTNMLLKSAPDELKKGTPASPAIAFASSVLPRPGGPHRRTPAGARAPRSRYVSCMTSVCNADIVYTCIDCRATARRHGADTPHPHWPSDTTLLPLM